MSAARDLSSSRRLSVFLLLVLHLLLAGAGPIVDAHLEGSPGTLSADLVESQEDGSDTPAHSHAHDQCQLCRVLQLPVDLPDNPAGWVAIAESVSLSGFLSPVDPPSPANASPLGARAPPVV